jgi:hypothetical protein
LLISKRSYVHSDRRTMRSTCGGHATRRALERLRRTGRPPEARAINRYWNFRLIT